MLLLPKLTKRSLLVALTLATSLVSAA
ncbi:MAG: hypothetical protein ACD_23C00431G0005, partial [uncultured bacterium]